MNEPLEPADLDPADLAASDALDDRVPDDGTGAGVDPAEIAARVEEFRAVRNALTTALVAPSPEVRDAQLANAVAAFTAERAGTDTTGARVPGAVAAPVSLEEHRARSGGRRSRWLAVAAAVAAIALAVPLVRAAQHRSTSTLSATPPTEAASTTLTLAGPTPDGGPSSSVSSPPTQLSGGSSTTVSTVAGPVGPPDVGSASSADELALLVQAAEPELLSAPGTPTTLADPASPTTTGSPAPPAAGACDASVRSHTAGLGRLVVATTAMFQGARVDVLVYEVVSGSTTSHRIEAVDPATCAVIVERSL